MRVRLSHFKSFQAAFHEDRAPFVAGPLACGRAIGFHDIGMHTSGRAMRSTLPVTDLLDNDTRNARLH